MEVLLRVEGESGDADGGWAVDVLLDVEPSHTMAAVASALAAHVGLARSSEPALLRAVSGSMLDASSTVGDVGLMSGESVRLVPGGGRLWGGQAPAVDEGPMLSIRSGPDAGRRVAVRGDLLTIGRDRSCTVALTDPNVSRQHAELLNTVDGYVVQPSEEARSPVTLDGRAIEGPEPLGPTNLVGVGASTFTVSVELPDSARSRRPGPTVRAAGAARVPLDDDEQRPFGTYPFHRTPYYPAPVPAVEFDALGEIPERAEPVRFAYLAAVAPLGIGIVMAFLYSPRFLIFTALSPVMAVAGYFEQRRRNKARYGRGEERFRRKLAERRADIELALIEERRRRFLGSPDIVELADRARHRSVDLWIRDRQAADVLVVRLGLGDAPAQVVVHRETRGDEVLRDELDAELAEIETIPLVPVTVDLDEHPILGLVGASRDVGALASSLLCQAACLHSPEDLVIAGSIDPSRSMDWLKWFPHTRSTSSPIASALLAETGDDGDRLIRELLVVAEERTASNDRTVDRRWPRVLVVIDRQLDPDPALVSRFLDLCPAAGMSVLWLTSGDDRVPRQAMAVVSCRSLIVDDPSVLAYTDPDLDSRLLEIERTPRSSAEEIGRSLAAVRDASSANGSTSLPRTVSLHEALAVEQVTPEWVARQWTADRGYRLLSPFGVSTSGPLLLDLVEHGPHGLIGGTSGSGKSELLISIVAGLIAHNPPTKVNFLFIDYKGGASSDLFKDMPHTVGYVTNLDTLLALRALTSLRAELNRRMDLLQGQAKDLAEMIERHPDEAPPSLVIVVDEFATLVKEVPDFLAGVVDIAQRGRSLGIHLLLATQRPSGAVNDNILANTNLRISLRMLDGSESSSVIGTPDAAMIPTPLKGRGFARFGPGDLVAFQSAWTGAALSSAAGPPPVGVAEFSSTGSLSAGPGPGGESMGGTDGSGAPARTQITGLLDAAAAAAAKLGMARGGSPWLDELPDHLSLTSIRASVEASVRPDDRGRSGPGERGWSVPVGLIDDPEGQAQYPALVDFETGGGLLVFGTGGSGKTTVLRTTAVSAALEDLASGRQPLTIFGLDFASRELVSLAALPQCAVLASGDDLEAVTRVIAQLDQELQARRAAVAAAARAGTDPPTFGRVLLLIDDYGSMAQTFEGSGASATLYPWLELINRVIVDGRQVGIHTALSASRRAAVKASVLSAISNRIVLRQTDAGSYAELGLPSSLVGELDLRPGRGFITGSTSVQVAALTEDPVAPFANGEREAIRALVPDDGRSRLDDWAREPLPVDLEALDKPDKPMDVALGRSDLDLAPVVLDLSLNDLVVIGDPRSGRSTALVAIGRQLLAGGCELWTVGASGSPLAGLEVDGPERTGFGRAAAVVPVLEALTAVAEAEPGVDRVVLIDDFDLLEDPTLDQPMARLLSIGVRYAVSAVSLRGYSTNPLAQDMKKARSLLYLQPPSAREVQELTGSSPRLRPGLAMVPGRAVLVVNRVPTVLQVANSGPR